MQTNEALDQFANFCQLVFDTSTACFYDDSRQTPSSFNSPNEKASQKQLNTTGGYEAAPVCVSHLNIHYTRIQLKTYCLMLRDEE